jgi:hypothetical protein
MSEDAVTKIISVFPKKRNPYYIHSPPYTRFSAGCKVLHLLCHNLNLKGFPAYLIIDGDDLTEGREDICEPDFLTPLLTPFIARRHLESGVTPIIIYPEVVSGNPVNAPCVVRYVLNFPGLLGGDKIYQSTELVFGFTRELAVAAGSSENILCIPNNDTRVFFPPENDGSREGSCFFAFKYQNVHKAELFDATKNSVEITSGLSTSQTPQEIADLFRRSEAFYTYENTALVLEATLCGCPAIFIPNEHLNAPIGVDEFGMSGIAWGLDDEALARAKETVNEAPARMAEAVNRFFTELDRFIEKSQDHARDKTYTYKDFLNLLPFISPFGLPDKVVAELRVKESHYAPFFLKLPWLLEREIGAFLCKLGLKKDGEFLWNRATKRSNKA